MKKLAVGILFLIILGLSIGSFFYFDSFRVLISRANNNQQSFSTQNSFIFVSPIRAKADNIDRVRITAFILNNQGLGVSGKTIQIPTIEGLEFNVMQGISDETGKVIVDVTSANKQDYKFRLSVEGQPLQQEVSLSYY